MSAALTERIRVASLPRPGSYRLQFDASRATLKPAVTFIILHNGLPIPSETRDTQAEAELRAREIAEETGSAVSCFSVDRIRA